MGRARRFLPYAGVDTMIMNNCPETMNATLFEKSVFTDFMKLRILRSSWIIQVGPKSNDKCPYEIDRRGEDSDTQRKGQRQSLSLRLLPDLVLRLVLTSTSENLFSLEEASRQAQAQR